MATNAAAWGRVLRKSAFVENGCLEYNGYRMKIGNHGLTAHDGYAHRVVYEACFGPVPQGKELHHTCHNPPCVHPLHLQVVTRGEHRAIHASGRGKDVGPCVICGDNDWLYYKSGPQTGKRYCHPCNRARCKATYQRRKRT